MCVMWSVGHLEAGYIPDVCAGSALLYVCGYKYLTSLAHFDYICRSHGGAAAQEPQQDSPCRG
jgi:hypothetical protein